MKNFVTRVVMVGIAVPFLFALAIYVPFMNHAPIALLVIAFALGSSLELKSLLEPAAPKGRAVAAATLGTLPPLAVYVSTLSFPQAGLVTSWMVTLGAVVMVAFVLFSVPIAFPSSKEAIPSSIRLASANALYLVYPGALSSAIIAILGIPGNSGLILIWFSLIVFGNDSLAWLAGVTLGRRKGIFAVSPNKSLEGLIAGIAGSVGFALAGPLLFPAAVPREWAYLSALGLACGAAVVTGDLFESAIKRSAGVKDSGSIIPGRGGILDSFDSLLFAAPVFVGMLAATGILA
ncbi:MAG: phosphatidate cytidylyltransferase [Spirochaetes bacterium]|nr:phosphatidate cytidylyltransferase [Spirochaetota bacterium]MBU1081355.1 phosphatidate cytidylyltransferase [Spirochaetota bacterium]